MKKTSRPHRFFVVLGLVLVLGVAAGAQKKAQDVSPLTEATLSGLEWRCIGPANMGGRIDDFAVVESNPHTFFIGTASGGVWKTTNNGVTWEPLFDDQVTSTIGDVTVAPSNPDIVWVGTGEPNNRQSSSWGNGVYKSMDGGRTWTLMGLEDTHHIGRIVIHPLNPEIVYVAALGHLWGPNKERGLYRTTDGGSTWVNTKFIDEHTGFVDVAIDPQSPNTLYAAAYQRQRRGWGFSGGGQGSGLYKTTDGGQTWTKLTNGLPQGTTGRIGIDIYRSNPHIVYAIIEHKKGGVFRSEDKGFSWTKMSSTNPRPMYYSQIRVDPNNDQRIWVLGASMYVSEDGGKNFRTDYVRNIHGDHHAMWIDPADSNHLIVGSDGGIYLSYDRGKTWDFVNILPLGQFYEIGVDHRKPYWVYGGLQDNGSWGGPSATWYRQGITNDEWIRIGGGDGFYTQVDPADPTIIYAESQNGNLFRFDLKSGESKSIRPLPEDPNENYRFNWNSPILISPHDPQTIYYGGNKLFISHDRGETWEATEDLTTQKDREKLPLMGVLPDRDTLSRHDGIAYFGDITAIAESPFKQGLLYVGTDDGNLQVSHDSGKTWTNAIDRVPGVPPLTYVTRVVASTHAEGTVYATMDGHRNDDFKPYVFVSTDYGESWKSIAGNLPQGGTVNVIREHPRNPNLLFVGTERGAYFSIDRGGAWIRFKGNLPIVPVDDIAVHPEANDLIFGTHGRSIWILDDITPVEQLTPEVLRAESHLFSARPAVIFNPHNHKGNLGHKVFVAPNPPRGAMLSYYLKEKAEDVKMVVKNSAGREIRTLEGPKEPGIRRMTWDLRYGPPDIPETDQMSRFLRAPGPNVLPGEYSAVLNVDGQEKEMTFQVRGDPRLEVTFEERKAQHDLLLRIYEMFPSLSAASRAADDIRKEVKNLEKALKKLPLAAKEEEEAIEKEVKAKEKVPPLATMLKEHLDGILKKVEGIRKELLGDPELGWRGMRFSIRGRLLMNYRSIGGFTGAPSPRQGRQVEEDAAKLESLIQRINALIETDIPKLNQMLNDFRVPRVFVGETIKIK